MKCFSFIVALAGLLGMCGQSQILSDKMLEYQLDGDQHVVVVVMDGLSQGEAKKIARQRAAEITVAQGDRYFTVDSEEKVEVIKSDQGYSNQRFYGNMYQELIIEQDFNKERLSQPTITSNIYPAIRLVFTPYQKRPNFRAVDACKYTDCGKN